MLLIVGLGNPGPKYEKNRHNVGFMAVDRIIDRHNFTKSQKKFKANVFEGKLAGEKTLILKPDTFMNLSGESVGEAMRFYKLGPEDIFVIHDELDLAAGKVRIKQGGSPGGHNGLKSIDAHCGKEYYRFRLGIGHPGNKARVNSHVLGDFAKSDADWLLPLLTALAENAELIAKRDNAGLMNKISLAIKPQQKQIPEPKKDQSKKAKSHIHQAQPKTKKPEPSGPMAEMLKKLLGKEED
ncbi:aminoacyl-tRNA hydrolase [Lentilitoribacter sp. EG35]|uniref:aminoacyl-tRNA hydrolase n=1 Tax=Lentilitoribacter sp. EG35 TaxID=3234192 RepID=UPI00345F99EE